MIRTTVYLEENTALAIRQLAEAENRPQAEIIREALDTYLRQAQAQGRRPLPPGIGAYRSGRQDVSEQAEALLRQAARRRRSGGPATPFMTLIADTGGLYALYDADDAHHHAVRRVIEQERGPLIVPMAILGELDYLLRTFLGSDAELAFSDGVAQGAYVLQPLTVADVARCRALIATYRDLDLGLADAAVIATAERYRVDRVLTVDERDFRAVTPRHGTLTLLPADREAT